MRKRMCRISPDALAGLVAAGILLLAGGAHAGARRIDPQRFAQQAALTDAGGIPGDELGWSVSLSGDGNTAVVSAPARGSSRSGKVIVYSRSGATWTPTATLVPSDPTGVFYFGYAVAINGDGSTVLIGAIAVNQGAGAAFVFHRSGVTWTQEAELQASDAALADQFGWSVALSFTGTFALVGAPDKSGGGAAYVFQRTGAGWVQRQELLASDGVPGDAFGTSVAVDLFGTTMLVGAAGRANATGAAYVFRLGLAGWTQVNILTGGDSVAPDEFGSGVSLSADGGTALVGSQAGSAYVFAVALGFGWVEQAELQQSAPGLGPAVSLSANGGVALVGSDLFAESGFRWSPATPLTTTSQKGSLLGASVSLSSTGERAVLGAPYEPGTSGAAYVVGLPLTTTTLSSSAQPVVVGAPVTYTARVSPIPSDGTVSFWAAGKPLPGCFLSPVDPTSGAATCSASFASAGIQPVTAIYSGGADLAGSSSTPFAQKVGYAITVLSPQAGSNLPFSSRMIVEFALSTAAGPLAASIDQQISDACDATVTISGVASNLCATYAPFADRFYASVVRSSGTSGPLTITVSVSVGGAQVSSSSITVNEISTITLPGAG